MCSFYASSWTLLVTGTQTFCVPEHKREESAGLRTFRRPWEPSLSPAEASLAFSRLLDLQKTGSHLSANFESWDGVWTKEMAIKECHLHHRLKSGLGSFPYSVTSFRTSLGSQHIRKTEANPIQDTCVKRISRVRDQSCDLPEFAGVRMSSVRLYSSLLSAYRVVIFPDRKSVV